MSLCDKTYRWVPYREASKYLGEAAREDVSEVARSSRGFMSQFKLNPNVASFCRSRVEPSKPETWGQRRRNFIARHLAQYRKRKKKRHWLALMMWAYRAGPMPQ